ncbi:MAG: hypothetical protein VW270_00695 [Candidatus Poseidoniales archaeon]
MIRASFVLGTLLSASVAASTLTATLETPKGLTVQAAVKSNLLYETFIPPLTNIPNDVVSINDEDLKAVTKRFVNSAEESNEVVVTDSDPVFDADKVLTDFVTVVETRVKVFTDFIDFDPSDADVDATPVTISESDAKDITVGELADNDDVTVSESTVKNSTKPGITASVSTSEAINQFRPQKGITDTATASEAIDRFDVTTEFDDTVTATEALAKNFTQVSTDTVNAVQSNIKAFTSNIDFDLSDADVDPDPVTASDAINKFDFNKGLSDTPTVTEATAKNFTHGGFSDTASPIESAAFDVTIPGIGDSFTAVEGIKNNPDIVKTDSISPSDSINSFSVTAGLSDTLNTPTDAIDSFTVNLAKSDAVTMTEVVSRNYTLVEDFDRTDADADPDPVTVTESIAFEQSAVFSDTLSPTESITQFAVTTAYSDTASITESINTLLTLGESSFQYPSRAFILDNDNNPSSIRGYHRGLGESGRAFVQDVFRFGTDGREEFVGLLGGAGLINDPQINNDTITYGDSTNAGLLVNFIYTDTDDTELNGHFLNETPLSAGRHI